MKTEELNRNYHLQGLYYRESLMSTVGNMFKKKGAKPYEYPTEPFNLKQEKKKDYADMTEEEILQANIDLFARLRTIGDNFKLSKGKG